MCLKADILAGVFKSTDRYNKYWDYIFSLKTLQTNVQYHNTMYHTGGVECTQKWMSWKTLCDRQNPYTTQNNNNNDDDYDYDYDVLNAFK